jgi:signal transduction histidine kinase
VFARRRLTVSARVAVAVALVLTIGVTVLSLAAYLRVSSQLSADLDRSLLREAEAFNAALRPSVTGASDLRTATRAYLGARAQSFSGTYPVLLVHFATGSPSVISNSDLLLENAPGNSSALGVRTARSQFLDLTLSGTTYRAATVPVLSATGTPVAVFEVALPTATTRDLATEVLVSLLFVSAAVIVLGTALAVLVARASLRPLTRAASTAARVTQSSLTQRIEYDGPPDEVGRMVEAINEMLDRLEGAFGEQNRFIADASHELRTPLAIVSGHLELLQDVAMGDDERTEELAIVSDEVARMGRLVDDLLALARLESAPAAATQPLEVSSMVQEAAARGRILGDRAIDWKSQPGLWVAGDPDQLTRALLNLVGNAVAHTQSGGHVALEASADGPFIEITVADDGPGIRDEDLGRVFDRFYRAAGPRPGASGGSGLGLAITKRLVQMHAGTVQAANRPGGGAVFTIRLPRISAPE